ncbi:HAMP domain-containing sensor histidine kinase [Pedobacter sp. UYP1]|uniref:sensor histidine kinase n=1 Tax=Pedobacter sp. UYP1 TaxID=1756396 RepID=UPI003395CDE6
MNKNHTTRALLIACILIVFTLSFIQFYLVRNTYRLTRDHFYTEVKEEILRVTNTQAMIFVEEQIRAELRQTVIQYVTNPMSKPGFIKLLKSNTKESGHQFNRYLKKMLDKKPNLEGIVYKSQFDEIIFEINGKSDTLLIAPAKPVVFSGDDFHTAHTIILNRDVTLSTGEDLRIIIRQSNFMDISRRENEVIKRMSGVLFLAIGLIVAVTILLYLVFSAMIRQKKLAEIKTDFANNITHELKTPLSSVSIILKSILLKEVQAKPALLNDLLQSLNRQHGKIRKLVDSVLDSAMVTAIKVEQKELEITSFLQEYAGDLAMANHELIAKIETIPRTLLTNAATLEKILNILVDNAAKYSEEGVSIYLTAFQTQTHYQIEITDQGAGIPIQYQQHIFDKFYRIPEQNKHTVKGLGLGLYLAKQATFQLSAELTVSSKPGKGSTFIISLPV